MTLLGTPPVNWYDRFTNNQDSGNPTWMQLLFNPGVTPQAPEFNELQSIFRSQFATLAKVLLADGTYVSGGAISVVFSDPNYAVTIAAGVCYAYGFFHNVPELTISITGVGTQTLQLVITDEILTGNNSLTIPDYNIVYDAELLDPVEGSENEGYAGADRLAFTYTVVENTPDAGPTIATFDDGQLVQTAPTLSLAQLLDLLQTYFYETFGSYIAVEPALAFTDEAALSTDPTNIELTVTGGTGYVQGVRYLNDSAVLQVLRPMTGVIQNNEPHTYTSGTKLFATFQDPILSVESITVLRQSPSVNITKGVGLSIDSIPSQYNPVSEIVSVSQSPTTYVQGVDYQQDGDAIQWLGGGSRPSNGTTYQVVVQYEYAMVQGVRTLTDVSNESHSYSGTTMNLTNYDVQSITTLYNQSTSTTLVLGTDYTIALNTGVITFIHAQTTGNTIKATYAYWAHSTEGDFVSRDSFVNGSDVVQYFLTPVLTPTGLTVNFLDQISFDTTSGISILNETEMFFTYTFTVGRIDYLAWHDDGTLRVIQGTPAQNPVAPSFTSADCPIDILTVPPEAVAANITFVNYENLTVSMADIRYMYDNFATLLAEIAELASTIANFRQKWNVVSQNSNFISGINSFTYFDVNTSSGPVTATVSTSPADGTCISFRRNGNSRLILQPSDLINGSSRNVNVVLNKAVIDLVAVPGGWEIK